MRHALPNSLALFWLLLAVALLPAQDYPRAQWLYYPEPVEDSQNVPRYYWSDLEIPQDVAAVRINALFDDGGEVLVDGKATRALREVPAKGVFSSQEADLTEFLPPGRHRVELSNTNGVGVGGVVCKLTVERANGELEEHFSNPETWKCAKAPSLSGGERASATPESYGDLWVAPWSGLFHVTPLACQKELQDREEKARLRLADLTDRSEIAKRLASEENPTARVEYQDGKAMIRIGEALYPAVLYSAHRYQNFANDVFTDSVRNFRNAELDLQIMGTSLRDIWKGEGQYDFSALDEWPWEALSLEPDLRILFNIDCREPPVWWMEKHPEELIVYLSPLGKTSTDDDCNKIPAPSFASELYRTQVCDFLKALVEYIEAQPWGKRVFGYRYDMGVYMEWHYYGMFYAPDDSQPMRRRFQEYVTAKYGTDAALQEAWGDSRATLKSATMSPLQERQNPRGGDLCDPVLDARLLDTMRCITEATFQTMVEGDRAIKEACGGKKLVGNFYGYFFNMPFPGPGQHPLLLQALESPYVDFTSMPPPYKLPNREFGHPQLSRGVPESYRIRNKLHVVEADTRTHVVTYGDDNNCYVRTPEETTQQLARDFVNALCTGCGFWYFDFAQGWYGDPLVGEYLKKLRPIWETRVPCQSAAQVAVVVDMDSVLYQCTDKTSADNAAADRVRYALSLAGVPCDTILSTDLEDPRLPEYKAYVFLNQVRHTPALVAQARRLRESGKSLVWLHHAGYIDEARGEGIPFMEELTGVPGIRQSDWTLKDLAEILQEDRLDGTRAVRELAEIRPALEIQAPADAGLTVTQALPPTAPGGAPRVTQAILRHPAGGGTLLALVPVINPEVLRAFLEAAGVHVYYRETDGILYANQSYVGLHLGPHGGGVRTIELPRTVQKVTQVLPEEKILSAEATDAIRLETAPNTTYLLRVEE